MGGGGGARGEDGRRNGDLPPFLLAMASSPAHP